MFGVTWQQRLLQLTVARFHNLVSVLGSPVRQYISKEDWVLFLMIDQSAEDIWIAPTKLSKNSILETQKKKKLIEYCEAQLYNLLLSKKEKKFTSCTSHLVWFTTIELKRLGGSPLLHCFFALIKLTLVICMTKGHILYEIQLDSL